MHTKFWSENLKGRDHSEDKGVDWEDNIRMNLKKIWWEGVYWIHLARDRDRWPTLVNTVVKLRVQ
jgi:hypothetical protein